MPLTPVHVAHEAKMTVFCGSRVYSEERRDRNKKNLTGDPADKMVAGLKRFF